MRRHRSPLRRGRCHGGNEGKNGGSREGTAVLANLIIIVMLAAGAWLGWRYWQRARLRPRSGAAPILHLQPGERLTLTGIGDDRRSETVRITRRNIYRQGNFIWWELEGAGDRGKVYLEMEDDDGLEVSVMVEELALDDTDQTGPQLDEIARNGRGTLTCRGRRYRFRESGRASFLPGEQRSRSESFTYWDFQAEDSDYDLAVERWEGGRHDVFLVQSLQPDQVTIESAGETQ